MDFKEAYFKLFGALASAMEELQDGHVMEAWEILSKAQREAEEKYINAGEP